MTQRWREMDSNHRYPEDKLSLQDGLCRLYRREKWSGAALAMFRSDGPKANLARDHNMHGNRRVALAGELELVESTPFPCRVPLPIILVISLAAWALALSLTHEARV